MTLGSRVYSASGRLRTIAQALTAIESVYPRRNEVSLIPIVDVLRLLVQRPIVLSFMRRLGKGQQTLLYTTQQDPEYAPAFVDLIRATEDFSDFLVPLPPSKKHGLLLSRVSRGAITHLSRNDPSARAYEALFELLQTGGVRRSASLLESIEAELGMLENGDSKLWEAAPAELLGPHLSTGAIDSLLSPVRAALDEAFGDVSHAPLLANPSVAEGASLPNIFAVIRTRPTDEKRRDVFPYTGQILCSSSQRRLLRQQFAADAVAKLEHPLERKARSIADAVYASGNVEFSPDPAGSGRDTNGRSLRSRGELERRALEKELYRQFDLRRRGRPTPFFVPVHTNGTPWILLFTITPRHLNPEERWAHHYHFYRDVALPIAERLRGAVQRAYLQQIAESLRIALSLPDSKAFGAYLHFEWQALLRVYPFNGLAARPTNDGGDIQLPNRHRYRLEQTKVTPFGRQVPYRLLGIDEVRQACRSALERQLQEWAQAQAASARQWLYQDHTIRLYLPVQELELLERTTRTGGDTANTRDLLIDAHSSCEIMNVALDIASAGLQGSRGSRPQGLANVRSVFQLLRWLQVRALSSGARPRLVIAPGASDRGLREHEIASAFTVFLNLWTNAAQYSSGYPSFWVQAHQRGDLLRIRILNRHRTVESANPVKAGDSSASMHRPRGLEIVGECLEDLGWPGIAQARSPRKILIEIQVPKER